MTRPDPFPPLRVSETEARATVEQRRSEGAALFEKDTRYTREMHDRFEGWYRDTATDLEIMFWAGDVAKWFREGTCWLVGNGSYRGLIETRDDRLRVLNELLERIGGTSQPSPSSDRDVPEEFDVCLSFAGEQRVFVEDVAKELQAQGVRVFYDRDRQADLWGKDLYEHLTTVYRDLAKYCVIFISKEYSAKQWTTLERKSAQARAFRDSREYILPARFDDTELPGLNETVGYVDLRQTSASKLAEMLVQKLNRGAESPQHVVSRMTPAGAFVSIVAEWRRLDVHLEPQHHDYQLLIGLHNTGRRKVVDWRLEVWLPNVFVPGAAERWGDKRYEEFGDRGGGDPRPLYPGDHLHVTAIDYFVDYSNWPCDPFLDEEQRRKFRVRIRVSADEMESWETVIPMAELQDF